LFVFGSEGWGFLLPGEFFWLLEVCFFTASSTSFLICSSMLTLAVVVFSMEIAVATVAVITLSFLNSAARSAAAFLILFSLSVIDWSLIVTGKMRLIN